MLSEVRFRAETGAIVFSAVVCAVGAVAFFVLPELANWWAAIAAVIVAAVGSLLILRAIRHRQPN